jgi:hypothetical protein
LKTHNFDEAPFSPFFRNVYSQNGEDGVIEEILNRIGWTNLSRWAVEFGAWDGQHLSNTFSLVESKEYSSVYIEGDPEKFNDLVSTAELFPKIFPIEAIISSKPGETNSLDSLLARTEIPDDFDVLSIDIDSFDLDIWESLSNYRPKIVVIEINSGIMPGVLSRHNQLYDGNSFSSTLQVALRKKYFLVCHTGNCIFVREDILPVLMVPERYLDYPELLFRYEPMWMPSSVSVVRLLVRKILPLRLKILIMTALSQLKYILLKDTKPKNS